MTPPGWHSILDEGEKILWQGRPDGAIHFRIVNMFTFLFGLAFAGFALFWMIMASQAGGFFWAFGLIHFSIGIGLSFGAVFWDAYKRRNTWYTLTDRRAFVATDLPIKGRSLKSYPITGDTVLNYRQGNPATIHFSQEARRGSKGRRYVVDIGFERIDEGDAVYRLLRKVQKGTTQ